jgi:hypothetical protein
LVPIWLRASEAGARAFIREPLIESVFVGTVRDVIAANPRVKLEQSWASK